MITNRIIIQSKSWTKMLRFIAVIPKHIGYELKRQLKIRQLRKNISTIVYIICL